jgi:phage terminase large subunit-like protein
MTLASKLAAMPEADRKAFLATLAPEELASLSYVWKFWARADQLPPPGDWRVWLLLGGRGSGKTRAAAEWIRDQVESGRRRHIGIVGPTADQVRRVQVEGPSGILAISPPWAMPIFSPATRTVSWPNGAVAHLFSAEEPDRLRGPNLDCAWVDELCSVDAAETVLDTLAMALRLPGPHGDPAQVVITTTPRASPALKSLINAPTTTVTRARTIDNAAFLDADTLDFLLAKYGNTTLGRQELDAEIIEDTDGALWNRALLDGSRVRAAPALSRVAIGLDPSGSQRGDIAGIVAVGVDKDRHIYVIGDHSGQFSPDGWARRAIAAYHEHAANFIVCETNFGGSMVTQMLNQIDPRVPVRTVHASRGKAIRAEPVSMLWEQGKAHVCGALPMLEDELCGWAPNGKGPSPGRLDALVWAATELVGREQGRPARWEFIDFLAR